MARRDLLVASTILRDRQNRVLRGGNEWQRAGRVRYTLPGGTVEVGETTHEAMIRETLEETGLCITRINRLAYCVHIEDVRRGERAIVMVFEAEWTGLLNPRDPDELIVDARFVTAEEAVALLDTPPLRDPLHDYLLTGECGRYYAFKGWDGRGGMRIPGLERPLSGKD